MVRQVLLTQGVPAGSRHSLTMYFSTGPPVAGGLRRMVAAVGEVGKAAAMTGALRGEDSRRSRRG